MNNTQKSVIIKNPAKVEELLAKGWTWDADQKFNHGQINSTDDETYYDAETDTFHTI